MKAHILKYVRIPPIILSTTSMLMLISGVSLSLKHLVYSVTILVVLLFHRGYATLIVDLLDSRGVGSPGEVGEISKAKRHTVDPRVPNAEELEHTTALQNALQLFEKDECVNQRHQSPDKLDLDEGATVRRGGRQYDTIHVDLFAPQRTRGRPAEALLHVGHRLEVVVVGEEVHHKYACFLIADHRLWQRRKEVVEP